MYYKHPESLRLAIIWSQKSKKFENPDLHTPACSAIPIFIQIRLVERHQPPEYNVRFLPPNSFLREIPDNQA